MCVQKMHCLKDQDFNRGCITLKGMLSSVFTVAVFASRMSENNSLVKQIAN